MNCCQSSTTPVLFNEPLANSVKYNLPYDITGRLKSTLNSIQKHLTYSHALVINDSYPSNTPTDILTCKTRTFYFQLLKDQETTIPAVEYWKRNLQPEPTFNTKQWKTLYPPLNCNKHGDVNWKIAHRVLPTALSLNNIGVYATPNCHRCGATHTLEHAIIDCPTVVNSWSEIQSMLIKLRIIN